MEKFLIQGGKKLQGEVEIMGSKNAAFPIIAASLLTNKPCVIGNIPLIEDVFRMLDILKKMGAEVSWLDLKRVRIKCSGVNPENLASDTIRKFRGSILFLGPLLAKFNKLKMAHPGGCIIGARPLDTHLDAFSQFGFDISSENNFYFFEKNADFKGNRNFSFSKNREIILQELSVTATENVMLYSGLSPEKTILRIADQDYQVQELINVLKKMGVKIKTTDPHVYEIEGKKNLNGFEHDLMADPIEAGTFIVASIITQGETTIKNARLDFLTLFLKKLKDSGANFQILKPDLIKVSPSNKIAIGKIQSLPYPGIHTDLQPELGVLATQTFGSTLIHDPLYEGRLKYLEELNKMGAEIIFCDPHRAIVQGPTPLYGIEIPSLDLRAGAALIIAGLVARGTTTINNVYQVDRGYEKIEERLQKLGADIKRVSV